VWKTLALLWLVPIAAGLVVLARISQGRPALSDDERLWLVSDGEERPLSPLFWLKFGTLSILFFAVGVLQALVVINLGGWLLAVPLLTGVAAMFVVLYWLC
jgi:hypothetical protein